MNLSIENINSELALRYENDFFSFVRFVFREIYRRPFISNWHHEVICKELEDIYSQKTQNIIFNIPPRHSKTELVAVQFPAWCYARNAVCNFINTTYSEMLALKNSNAVRNIIASEEYQRIWARRLVLSEKSKQKWSLEEGGSMRAASSGGAITGFGAGGHGENSFGGAIIIDDPQKPNSYELGREQVIDNFENVLATRRNTTTTPIIVIMQRLHEQDLTGYLLSGRSSAGEFRHVKLEALKENVESQKVLGGSKDYREEGEALWTLRQGRRQLENLRDKNPALFAGQYQQRPAPAEGNMVKRRWIKYYDPADLVRSRMRTFISCDLTFKKEGTSNVALSVYGVDPELGAKIFLLDQVVAKMNFVESRDSLMGLAQRWKYEAMLIEDKASGPVMCETLKRRGFRAVIPVPVPALSKLERFARITTFYVAGDIHYPQPDKAPWILPHINEIVTFPNSKYDDRVDAESQFLDFFDTHLRSKRFINI